MQSMEQKRQKLVEEFRKVCADWSILIIHSSLFNFKCLCLVFDFKSFIFVENHSFIFFLWKWSSFSCKFFVLLFLNSKFWQKKKIIFMLSLFLYLSSPTFLLCRKLCLLCMHDFFLKIFLSGWAVCLLIVVDLALVLTVLLSGKGRIVKLGEENPRNIQNAVTSNCWWQ